MLSYLGVSRSRATQMLDRRQSPTMLVQMRGTCVVRVGISRAKIFRIADIHLAQCPLARNVVLALVGLRRSSARCVRHRFVRIIDCPRRTIVADSGLGNQTTRGLMMATRCEKFLARGRDRCRSIPTRLKPITAGPIARNGKQTLEGFMRALMSHPMVQFGVWTNFPSNQRGQHRPSSGIGCLA